MQVLESERATTTISPFRGRWLWATIVVALGVLLMCRLGIWQLQRLQERRAQNAVLLERLNQPPVELAGQPVDPEQVDLRRGEVRGAYDYAHEFLLRNQSLAGLPGAHVITPLRIAGSDQAVLVDRGWVPLERSDPQGRATVDRPAGAVAVAGVIRHSQARSSSLSPADPPVAPGGRNDAWFRIDIPHIQAQIPYPLMPVFLEEGQPVTNDATPPMGRLPIAGVEIDLSEGSHLGYAIQWFSFAAILLAGYVLFLRSRTSSRWVPDSEPDAA